MFQPGMSAVRLVVALSSQLAVAACAESPAVMDLAAFKLADIRNAQSLAAGDAVAAPCWAALERVVLEAQAQPAGPITGPLSAFQAARNRLHPLERGIPPVLLIGCGPLMIQEQMLVARLSALAAGL